MRSRKLSPVFGPSLSTGNVLVESVGAEVVRGTARSALYHGGARGSVDLVGEGAQGADRRTEMLE